MRKLEFASLQVRDLETSKAFYTNKLGFEALETKNPDAVIFKYQQGEASFAIRKPLGNLDHKELGTGVALWFAIDEKIEDLQAAFLEAKVSISGEIMDTPFGKTLNVIDPDGYKITFLEAK